MSEPQLALSIVYLVSFPVLVVQKAMGVNIPTWLLAVNVAFGIYVDRRGRRERNRRESHDA